MNRQTLAVTFGTLALVVIGAILLYASPTPEGNRAQKPPKPAAEKAAKGKTGAPAKVAGAKLVHTSEVPADRAAAPDGAPNVVLVVLSAQRRDQWTLYDGPPETTPFLVEQSAQGTVFDDALAVAVDPRPATAALITGRYPHGMGMVELSAKKTGRQIPQDATTLAELFQQGGWYTLGLTGSHHMNVQAGQAQGFDYYRDAQPNGYMLDRRTASHELVDRALETLDRRAEGEKGRPVYLQLAFVDSHKPFRVPPGEAKPFDGPDHKVSPYRAIVRRQDDQLRRLTTELASRGHTPANTLFAVVADHGEGLDMPKHHRRQHGYVLYPSSVQIPWIMWGAGVGKGKRVGGLASQIDVAPTMAALAGVSGETMDGMDLSEAASGASANTGRKQAYADTFYEGSDRASLWTATTQCQRDFGSTGIKDSMFVDGCFDRLGDPEFDDPSQNAELLAALEAQRAQLLETLPQ